MTGPADDRLSGERLLPTGRQGTSCGVAPAARVPAAIDLCTPSPSGCSESRVAPLAHLDVAVHPDDVAVMFGAEWMDDLHSPTLVISSAYIGPNRRRSERVVPNYRVVPSPRIGSKRTRTIWHVALIVWMTLMVSVPLTLVAARSLRPTPSPPLETRRPPDRVTAISVVPSTPQGPQPDAAPLWTYDPNDAVMGGTVGGPSVVASIVDRRRPAKIRTVGTTVVADQQLARVEARSRALVTAHQQAIQAQVKAQARAAALRRIRVRADKVADRAAAKVADRTAFKAVDRLADRASKHLEYRDRHSSE